MEEKTLEKSQNVGVSKTQVYQYLELYLFLIWGGIHGNVGHDINIRQCKSKKDGTQCDRYTHIIYSEVDLGYIYGLCIQWVLILNFGLPSTSAEQYRES